jgi:hypothetical protein
VCVCVLCVYVAVLLCYYCCCAYCVLRASACVLLAVFCTRAFLRLTARITLNAVDSSSARALANSFTTSPVWLSVKKAAQKDQRLKKLKRTRIKITQRYGANLGKADWLTRGCAERGQRPAEHAHVADQALDLRTRQREKKRERERERERECTSVECAACRERRLSSPPQALRFDAVLPIAFCRGLVSRLRRTAQDTLSLPHLRVCYYYYCVVCVCVCLLRVARPRGITAPGMHAATHDDNDDIIIVAVLVVLCVLLTRTNSPGIALCCRTCVDIACVRACVRVCVIDIVIVVCLCMFGIVLRDSRS